MEACNRRFGYGVSMWVLVGACGVLTSILSSSGHATGRRQKDGAFVAAALAVCELSHTVVRWFSMVPVMMCPEDCTAGCSGRSDMVGGPMAVVSTAHGFSDMRDQFSFGVEVKLG